MSVISRGPWTEAVGEKERTSTQSSITSILPSSHFLLPPFHTAFLTHFLPSLTPFLSLLPSFFLSSFLDLRTTEGLIMLCQTLYCVLLRMLISIFCLSPQIVAEFRRVTTLDLLESFLEGLDGLVPRLLEAYKAATKYGKKQSLKNILDCLVRDVRGRGDD